jgi:hypothetical protein
LVFPETLQANEVVNADTVLCEERELFYITNILSFAGSNPLALANAEGLSKVFDVIVLVELIKTRHLS